MRMPEPRRPFPVPAEIDLAACRHEAAGWRDWAPIPMSGYYVKTDWSAVTLCGYARDPYQTQQPRQLLLRRSPTPDDILRTDVSASFEACLAAADALPGRNERVRINRLGSGSVIPRHYDRNEPWPVRTFVRFHIPLVTHWRCLFLVWGYDGQIYEICQREGGAWFVDTHMVHALANGSPEPRLHLVVDKFVDDAVEAFLTAALERAPVEAPA